MATMNASLTDTMKELVENQDVIIEALIAGENSGESDKSVADIWQEVQKENR
ncbi:hypothetical protein SPONN_1801 [uncultured Candidatus Thioglobus sp.]|nr:hypothetical protein SPONN_1801 [uncultured Candidatus Thioglobus sp.]